MNPISTGSGGATGLGLCVVPMYWRYLSFGVNIHAIVRHMVHARQVRRNAFSCDSRTAYHLASVQIHVNESARHPGCHPAHYAAAWTCPCSLCMTSVLL